MNDAIVIYELDIERNIYPNMTVEKKYYNGEFAGWKITANDGYVIYDVNENNVELNPETDEEFPVIYFYAATYKNPRYNWKNFNYKAELRSDLNEKYIFDGKTKNKEVL